jgi:hypothetical protein
MKLRPGDTLCIDFRFEIMGDGNKPFIFSDDDHRAAERAVFGAVAEAANRAGLAVCIGDSEAVKKCLNEAPR